MFEDNNPGRPDDSELDLHLFYTWPITSAMSSGGIDSIGNNTVGSCELHGGDESGVDGAPQLYGNEVDCQLDTIGPQGGLGDDAPEGQVEQAANLLNAEKPTATIVFGGPGQGGAQTDLYCAAYITPAGAVSYGGVGPDCQSLKVWGSE